MISYPVKLFWHRVNQSTLYMSSVWQGSFNYRFEIFGLTRPGNEPGPPRHRANSLTTRLPSWSWNWQISSRKGIRFSFHCVQKTSVSCFFILNMINYNKIVQNLLLFIDLCEYTSSSLCLSLSLSLLNLLASSSISFCLLSWSVKKCLLI